MSLRLDWCSHAAAKYAVEHWHYSGRMPVFKLAKLGVWEHGEFVGAVIFGVGGGNSTNGRRFGLRRAWDMAELVRVALTDHDTPTSKIVAVAIRMLKSAQSGLRLLTSFADSKQGHRGTIYQATGWLYLGAKTTNDAILVNGEIVHPRTLYDRYGPGGQAMGWLRTHVAPDARRIITPPKHHYVYPLDKEIRARIEPMAKPYPKRATSIDSDAAGDQSAEGGANPTVALSSSE